MNSGYDTVSYLLLIAGLLVVIAHLVVLYAIATWIWTGDPKLPWPQRRPSELR